MNKHYSISCPEELMADFDKLIENGLYSNRSNAIQEAMRDLINKIHEKQLLKMKVNTGLKPPTRLTTREEPQ